MATRLKEDPDFYARIGSLGGKKSKRHLSHETAVLLGKSGGRTPHNPVEAEKRRQERAEARKALMVQLAAEKRS
jgi:general stress protein YciG